MTPFDYTRADTLEAAVGADGAILAGGTNLLDLMKIGVATPSRLVDISRLPMREIDDHDGGLRIGAMVSNADLARDPRILARFPAVAEALRQVGLQDMAQRRPAQLSGGQQQRIALARALVFDPQLVLMDEPLGALDKQLREHMQYEIKSLHDNLGITVVYVTHDQGEALTMSDRIAVFNDGRIQQLAPPSVLYEKPENSFVAGFIGENNKLPGRIEIITASTW